MKNPYASSVAKRPRPEEQPAAAAVESSSHSLDHSFDSSGVDWDEAFNVLDQASQSYEQRETRPSLPVRNDGFSALENRKTVPPHSQTSQTHAAAASENNAIDGERSNKRPPAASPGGKPVNPYRNSNATELSVNGGVIDRKPEAKAASSLPSSQPVLQQHMSQSQDHARTVHPTNATRTGPDSNHINTTVMRPLETDSSALPAHPTKIPRPATWGSSVQAASAMTSRPASSHGPLATTQSHHAKPVASVVPSLSIPRPLAWDATKSTTASGKQGPGSRPSSSHGQPQQNNDLPAPLRYAPERTQPANDEYRPLLVKNANLSAPLLNGWTLFGHQKKAILRSLLMRRFILALDMGLGKTLIGCVWAKAFQKTFENLKILVVCPVSLKKEWKRTAEDATGLQVDDDAESTNVQIHGWSKTPSEVPPTISKYVVVFDEAHSMQSMQAARTKAALKLVQSQRCVGVLMLTGTPMKNGKPLNLFPLLKAARHPFGHHQKAYEKHFCAGHDKSFGSRIVWDANGSSNLVQLRQHVSSHLLYMTKEECLDELPPKTREFRQVPVSSRHQIQHDSALSELAKVYNTSGSFEKSGDVVLTAVQRVRQIGSFAKIDATVAIAKDVLQEQPAIVIFTSFVTVAKTVHKQLSEAGWEGELLTGETPVQKRQPMVDNFQAGLSPVFILTYGAGGVGLTLTAAHTIILLDRPWTPGEAQQAEDRVRRIGQTKPVTSIWMVAFDLDKQIDSVLEQKTNTCSVVLKDGQDNASGSAPKISVFALLKTLMGNKSSNSAPKINMAAQLKTGT